MPIAQLSTGAVHYAEHGHGSPVVLLHANPGDSRDFDAVIPALSKRHRVLALDWPGYGESAPPKVPESVDVSFFRRVLREFLDALALPPAVFIGNSLGGNAAAHLAADAPERVRALVLVAPGGFTTPTLVSRGFCRLQGSQFSLPPSHFARLYLKHRTAVTRAMLARASTTQAAAPQLALNRAVWRGFASPDNDLRAIAGRIQVPVLLIFGQQDPVIPASKDGAVAAACMPAARCVALPCGHAAFAEVPDRFLAEVEPFLNAAIAMP